MSSWAGLPAGGEVGPPRLSRGTYDKGAALRTDREALQRAWSEGRVRLLRVGPGATIPVTPGPALRWEEPLPWQGLPADAWILGRSADGLVWLAVPDEEPQRSSLFEVGAELADDEAGLAVAACALWQWHTSHRFCPADGAPTEVTSGGWATRCTACGTEHFPRTDPAVIMLVTDPAGERAVLGRSPHWPEGRFSCLAGFVEVGESAEQCVAREVLEEAALVVRDVRPVASQPWPFPRSLMLGYRAVTDADAEPRAVDGELAEVRWFSRAEVRAGDAKVPPALSVAHHLISGWLAEG